MSVQSQANHRLSAPLGNRIGAGASAKQIGAAVFAIWEEVDDVLTPIIGPRGVTALYYRSLHLTSARHPWLPGRQDDAAQTSLTPAALKSLLSQQDPGLAAAAGVAFLQTFHELLASLIGPSLTERLLLSAWENSLGSPPAQDTSS